MEATKCRPVSPIHIALPSGRLVFQFLYQETRKRKKPVMIIRSRREIEIK
jgi:hypothetical protein